MSNNLSAILSATNRAAASNQFAKPEVVANFRKLLAPYANEGIVTSNKIVRKFGLVDIKAATTAVTQPKKVVKALKAKGSLSDAEFKKAAAEIKAHNALVTAEAEVRERALAANPKPEPVHTTFMDKNNVQHSTGCGIAYLLDAARGQKVSRKKAQDLCRRAVKTFVAFKPDWKASNELKAAWKLGPVVFSHMFEDAIREFIHSDRAHCACRHTCPKCHSTEVVGHGQGRIMCKSCERTSVVK